eukprot:m.1333277 g.1333277  ORF g.1333277 m.1333277 type:complete len:177 (-) comp24870_c0_seq6:2606-3136(-)
MIWTRAPRFRLLDVEKHHATCRRMHPSFIHYIRSLDGIVTFATGLKLNKTGRDTKTAAPGTVVRAVTSHGRNKLCQWCSGVPPQSGVCRARKEACVDHHQDHVSHEMVVLAPCSKVARDARDASDPAALYHRVPEDNVRVPILPCDATVWSTTARRLALPLPEAAGRTPWRPGRGR